MNGATNPTQTATTSFTPAPQIAQQEYIHRAAWKAGMLGAVNVMAKVLAARLIVLVAIVGGIMLALPALSNPDWVRMAILGVYCLGVVFPAVALAAWGR